MSRVRIKMCGMTHPDDIAYAGLLGVDAIGIIFYPQSPRHVEIEQVPNLLQHKPIFVDAVGVFVNPDSDLVKKVISICSLQYLQFHGEESPEFCAQFALPYIKAIPATSGESIKVLAKQHEQAAAFLLDTPSLNIHGGTGQMFDWQVIPQKMHKPVMLAGGLNPANIQAALTGRFLDAVDVCSGIEVMPGVKDHEKMRQFVENVATGK